MVMLCLCALVAWLKLTAAEDTIALLQQSVAPHVEASTGLLDQIMSENKAAIEMAPEVADMMRDLTPTSYVTAGVEGSKQAGKGLQDVFAKGWKSFYDKSHKMNTSDPQILLQNAKAALLETGAMEQMRQMAVATANATRSKTQGAVPLDSMMVGFRTSVAPWNNLLRMLAMPLVKASFTIFTNFFGPQGSGARLCIGAQVAADSTYGVHTRSEFGGINVWIGPAKWDNVPGWSFGTSGGVDDIAVWDVSDFAWTWTLAKVPETVGFHWDVLLIDDETLHAGMLQTEAKTQTEAEKHIHRHGSTWIQHVWCSPHWENTPLVIPEDEPVLQMKAKPATGTSKDAKEEWDPDSEAV